MLGVCYSTTQTKARPPWGSKMGFVFGCNKYFFVRMMNGAGVGWPSIPDNVPKHRSVADRQRHLRRADLEGQENGMGGAEQEERQGQERRGQAGARKTFHRPLWHGFGTVSEETTQAVVRLHQN